MSATATVTFTFDGTRERFDQIYELVCRGVCDVALDIGTYFEGTQGTIEFMVDDYAAFEKKIAQGAAKIGVHLVPANFIASEKRPNQAPEPTRFARGSS